ncbi:OmpA family protein [Thiomicrorhabdus sp. Kp2]|uniref:OmpA family protein n=1 Tax=Thiomicrorhabdus sp. Kp2 TaxID=1123518 RepID=UPI0003FC4D0C|nr:OmpA family protein [Thiomicrorhabdus sp. Kp2]
MKTKLLPLVAVIAMASAASVQAHSSVEAKGDIMAEGSSAYVVDSWGRIVRDNENRCVRSIDWSKDTAIAKCEGWEEPKPVVAPAPAPAPAPVVKAPEPAPAPMAPAKFIGHFDFDKADVKEVPELDTFAAYMNEVADSKISITGHTDSTGPEAYNQTLSVKRAQDVADYLAGKGIAADRMMVSGAGESSPIADNATKAGRAENRRVEVEIVK